MTKNIESFNECATRAVRFEQIFPSMDNFLHAQYDMEDFYVNNDAKIALAIFKNEAYAKAILELGYLEGPDCKIKAMRPYIKALPTEFSFENIEQSVNITDPENELEIALDLKEDNISDKTRADEKNKTDTSQNKQKGYNCDSLQEKILNNKDKCILHRDRYLDVYCMLCKIFICFLCSNKSHKNHRIMDAETVKKNILFELQNIIWAIKYKNSGIKLQIKSLNEYKYRYLSDLNTIEKEVLKKKSKLEKILKNCTNLLMEKFNILKVQETTRIAHSTSELGNMVIDLRKFIEHINKIINEKSIQHLNIEFETIAKRAKVLYQEFTPEKELFSKYVSCTSYNLAQISIEHILGEVTQTENKNIILQIMECETCNTIAAPYILSDINQISEGLCKDSIKEVGNLEINCLAIKKVRAENLSKRPMNITSCNYSIYIIYKNSNEVEIFDMDTLEKKGAVYVPDLKNPTKITTVYGYLLITEKCSETLHCVNMKHLQFTRWVCCIKNINKILTLMNGNILLLGTFPNILVEYDVKGIYIRSVSLPSVIKLILDVTVFDHGQLVILYVSDENNNHISILNENGEELLSCDSNLYNNIDYSKVLTFKNDNLKYCMLLSKCLKYFIILDKNLKFVYRKKLIETEKESEFEYPSVTMKSKKIYICSSDQKLTLMKIYST